MRFLNIKLRAKKKSRNYQKSVSVFFVLDTVGNHMVEKESNTLRKETEIKSRKASTEINLPVSISVRRLSKIKVN